MAKSDGNRPGGDEGRSSITHTLEIFTKFAENYWLAGFGQVWAPGVGAMPIDMHIAASLDQRNAKQQPSTNNYRFRVGCDRISEPAIEMQSVAGSDPKSWSARTMTEATNSLSRNPLADNCCSISYSITNTLSLSTLIPKGKLIDDRHIAIRSEPNTTSPLTELSLQSEGISNGERG